MISAEQVAELAGSLGTLEGLARVGAELTQVNATLADSGCRLARAELDRLGLALSALARVMVDIGRVTRSLIAQLTAEAGDYAG